MLATALLALTLECGTSPVQIRSVEDAAASSQVIAKAIASKGLSAKPAALRDGVVIVPADDTNSPWRRPADLSGRSLTFTRQGPRGFRASNIPLSYSDDRGSLLSLDSENEDEEYGKINLGFDFPFFDRTLSELFVTRHLALFVEEPLTSTPAKQFGDHDLALETRGVIAPLMTTTRSHLIGLPAIFVKRSDDRVTVTWTSPQADVQATLHRNGDIAFAYKNITPAIAASGVLITSGQESWRTERNLLTTIPDGEGDVQGNLDELIGSMLDLTGVTVNRVSDLDLLEVSISTKAPIDRTLIPEGDFAIVSVIIGDSAPYQYVRIWFERNSPDLYTITSWGAREGTSAARISGSTISLTFLDEHIAGARPMTVRVASQLASGGGDVTVGVVVPFGTAAGRTRTDFSRADGILIDNAPIAEAFSAAILSPGRVWNQVKEAYPHITDGSVDGVAIYQNFYTDIVTYAGAYSTGGNAGASGLFRGDTDATNRARTPALLHMNAIGYGHNRTLPGASRVLLHELGHRWLLFVSLMENGTPQATLNPVSAHPAQYVDTRAAFNVYTETDTSVMGGGYFSENGDGTYTTSSYGPYGYSWLDLYLMGLAAPDEVPNWFYIADSSPRLGNEYYAPPNATYRGLKKPVSLGQVVAATGVRKPAYPDTQRTFRMVYVIVADPDRPVTDAEIDLVNDYRRTMEADFVTATSGRASVSSVVEEPVAGPRRRTIRR